MKTAPDDRPRPGDTIRLTEQQIRWCEKLCEIGGFPISTPVQVLFHPEMDPDEPVLYRILDEDGEVLISAAVYPQDPGGMYIRGKYLPVPGKPRQSNN